MKGSLENAMLQEKHAFVKDPPRCPHCEKYSNRVEDQWIDQHGGSRCDCVCPICKVKGAFGECKCRCPKSGERAYLCGDDCLHGVSVLFPDDVQMIELIIESMKVMRKKCAAKGEAELEAGLVIAFGQLERVLGESRREEDL